MTAVTDLSALVNRMTGGNSGTPDNRWFHKIGRYNGVAAGGVPIAARPFSLWSFDGQPGPGAAPTVWANPTRATAGALAQTNPAGGRQKWMTQFSVNMSLSGTVILYDRLGHKGNLDATNINAQTFTGSLTRYTNGIGNMMWYEIYGNATTILGATATTMTVGYDAPEGTAFNSPAVPIGGTALREGNQARFIPLTSGHTGVIKVNNVDLLASTGTIGAFGITVAHPLAYATINTAGLSGWRDFVTWLPGLPEVLTDACLAFLIIVNTITAPDLIGCVSMIEA